MLVRREAIEQVGVMDEQFFMYGEDTDWCYRLKKDRWKVMFAPAGQIIHLEGASSRQNESKMRLQLSGSILLFLRKHKSWPQYEFACLLTALFFLVRVPYWFGTTIVSKRNRNSAFNVVRNYILGFFLSLGGWKRLCVK